MLAAGWTVFTRTSRGHPSPSSALALGGSSTVRGPPAPAPGWSPPSSSSSARASEYFYTNPHRSGRKGGWGRCPREGRHFAHQLSNKSRCNGPGWQRPRVAGLGRPHGLGLLLRPHEGTPLRRPGPGRKLTPPGLWLRTSPSLTPHSHPGGQNPLPPQPGAPALGPRTQQAKSRAPPPAHRAPASPTAAARPAAPPADPAPWHGRPRRDLAHRPVAAAPRPLSRWSHPRRSGVHRLLWPQEVPSQAASTCVRSPEPCTGHGVGARGRWLSWKAGGRGLWGARVRPSSPPKSQGEEQLFPVKGIAK